MARVFSGTQWRELTPPPPGGVETVRIEAPDLRRAQRFSAQIRADAVDDGCGPSVMLDIEVVIDADPPTARRRLSAALETLNDCASNTVRFVGTASGLAGLIADVYVLGIADGVALIPLADQRQMSEEFDLVVRLLHAKGLLQPEASTPLHAAG
ncbi:hypothetical protein [Mycobacterium paraterrae]|uniref:Uncharacterized protein n=1 Tax=Mycobacterium paraterrae TaxID=577492 RepID=A0ABY3VFX1_9MYCO|nr:hypothetical protein [Mycobacterium paraterrae]UMB68322.1 hypothetical protein MKK62_18025 [Mycobacterium paraterrae]